ncbi:MAG: hypothetical protein ACXV3C_03180 [Actinomycetes bacterium]
MTAVLLVALALLALAGCTGGSGGGLPSLTATPTRSPSASLPTRTPGASTSAALTSSAAATSAPPATSAPAATSTTARPATTTRSATSATSARESVTQAPPSATAEISTSASASVAVSASASVSATTVTSEPAASGSDSNGIPAWAGLALLALAVAAIGIALWQRGRSSRRHWAASLDSALTETQWLARDLLPSLLTTSREGRRGGWGVARARVLALQDRLAALAASAPDEAGSGTARQLDAAVTDVRQALDAEAQSTGEERAAEAFGAVQQAARQLDQQLAAVMSPAPPAG